MTALNLPNSTRPDDTFLRAVSHAVCLRLPMVRAMPWACCLSEINTKNGRYEKTSKGRQALKEKYTFYVIHPYQGAIQKANIYLQFQYQLDRIE